jgi:hypothetical protein
MQSAVRYREQRLWTAGTAVSPPPANGPTARIVTPRTCWDQARLAFAGRGAAVGNLIG